MDEMFNDNDDEWDPQREAHKEEGKARRPLDRSDRMKIQEELSKYPNPLKYSDQDILFNIVNGHIADEKVNVHNALAIGERMAAEFKGQLPEGFYNSLHSDVTTMESMKKGVKVGDKTVYDMERLYGRLLVISEVRNITLEYVLGYELAVVPPALFDE